MRVKKPKLPDAGFSLLEMLVAVVVLAVLAVPILHMFVTTANINANSRRVSDLTREASNIMESLKAAKIEKIASGTSIRLSYNGLDFSGDTGIYTADYDGYRAEMTFTPLETSEGDFVVPANWNALVCEDLLNPPLPAGITWSSTVGLDVVDPDPDNFGDFLGITFLFTGTYDEDTKSATPTSLFTVAPDDLNAVYFLVPDTITLVPNDVRVGAKLGLCAIRQGDSAPIALPGFLSEVLPSDATQTSVLYDVNLTVTHLKSGRSFEITSSIVVK
ncbi:hypothetical protein FACS1894208_03420 [Clostridia bacterium]|nr:hypothetical protein FACS1894208_03420 [Clostridia bacterium]